MTKPQITTLPGDRLHLNHGPIDLILWAEGDTRAKAYGQAIARFDGLLAELAAELPALRSSLRESLHGPIARIMQAATDPYRPTFITPMAAVAGAVADTVLAAMTQGTNLTRAYVNNGGDIALHLAPGHSLTSAIAQTATRVTLHHADTARGLATSGWRGRSFSLGIADAVTVVAATAAQADAAATIIANAVDCPGHPGITRFPAHALQHDSDLGDLMVTTQVAGLSQADIIQALDRGAKTAQTLITRKLIAGAALFLHSETRTLGILTQNPEPALA